MNKILVSVLVSLIVLSLSSAAFSSEELDMAKIEGKISSIAHYAEEYEIGNINYFQLNVYGFKIRSDLNLLLGGGIGNEWARIPKESVEKAFGAPADYTYWVWVDNKNMEKRFDDAMPWWERVIFDGRKIRITFNSFPSAIEMENGTLFRYYRVDLNVKFKKEYNFDLDGMMKEVASLAADYNMTRTKKSGEALARKMLETQSIFGRYAQENSEQCVEIMETVFTPEEKSTKEKVVWWKFPLYSGSDFDVMVNIDMCEECEFHYVNLMLDIEGRGPMNVFSSPELQEGKLEHKIDEEYFRTLSIDEVNRELNKTVFEVRDEAQKFDKTRSSDFPKKFFFDRFKVQQLGRILQDKYNNVNEFDKDITKRIESGELQGPGGCKNLSDCRKYCEKMENTQECRKFTYNLRVDLLEKMFAGFDIEKTPHDRIWWERRVFENFGVRQDSWCRHVNDVQCKEDEGCVDGECVSALGGNETCDNRVDDDDDRLSDCQDPDCWKERQCGKLCEKVCNKEGGCWQTSNELCSGVCKECWDCGGDEKCKSVCEAKCWPCHNQEAIKNVCDDCRACEDEAYGGCYVKCKPCDACNTNRMEKMRAIFDRAAREGIKMPGGCMSEDQCSRYCAEHGEECGVLNELGFFSEEFDCNAECKECTICNYDQGNFNCRANQHFERDSGFCPCDKGWYDCDGNWENGCESDKQCRTGPCFEECEKCDTCKEGEDCGSMCLECNKCKAPGMPTYVCDGVEQPEPCGTEYVCNGVKQKKPCENYICNGRKSTKPCDEITSVACGKNQVLTGGECICREGFKDCDSDGNCESVKSCGLEICDDGKDNNNDGSVDCQDAKCNRQVCGAGGGKDLMCINRVCMPPEKEVLPKEPEPVCGNHLCEKTESKESCPKDCVVCELYNPPECPDGKIVWKGKDSLGCSLPPICVITEKVCEADGDCPQPKCGVSQCVKGTCKVTELTTDCKDGCMGGRTKKRVCKDGSEIVTSLCDANQWVGTGYDCPEALEILPVLLPESPENASEKRANETAPPSNAEPAAEEQVNETVPPQEPAPETPETPPKEKARPEKGTGEIAQETEEEPPEVCSECVLMGDCGGSQDVCSNGNCVTLPIAVEEKPSKNEKQPKEADMEKPAKEPETPKEAQPEEQQEPAPGENPATGEAVASLDSVAGWFTGLFGEGNRPCSEECKPCDECNRKFDELGRRLASGEVTGPNNCKSRMECEGYCQMEEHREECKAFLSDYGIEASGCWQNFCRECDKCRFKAGELKCNANQQFSMEEGFCKCNEGWYDCDGDWENGCESDRQCSGCQSKDDCAKDRCAPWGNVIQQFDCFEGEEWVEEKGVLRLEGQCRFYPTKKTQSHLAFDMWGEPFFEGLSPIKEEVEREKGWEWCSWELENLIKERVEMQNSLTKDFLKWFFEDYVPSSPGEWEKHIGGIYDSYWRIVNNDRSTAEMLRCTGSDKWPEEFKKIDVSYDTEYGSVRIWETETTTDFFGKSSKIFSPYMQIWVFPPKDFVKKMFQHSMEVGTIPGPGGEKKPEFSPSETEAMKKDERLMKMMGSLADRYGGEAKILFSIVDGQEMVFSVLATLDPDNVMKIEPMKDYTGDYDVKMTMNFDFFYRLMSTGEKNRGGDTMYPPWETGIKIGDIFKGAADGVKMLYMMTSAIVAGDIKAEPPTAVGDGLAILYFVFQRG